MNDEVVRVKLADCEIDQCHDVVVSKIDHSIVAAWCRVKHRLRLAGLRCIQ
ncbi:hypothetical protein JQ634_29225 [Bradyrhizobium sp. AUGA SZCCT0240]|uniref:hypothetical protein n=1 Tax=Bradyrhizobium sp. AUGA SZCCT0240 TaxID=2807669 RepID=UPI001BACB22B|nr:hypothetical protein [Bradyrhizobium sp. AUGA SZCCT0240]MBR1257757.1 hypothetical protein [Bradyrhizobium sp. AUGA SZCCT0240]